MKVSRVHGDRIVLDDAAVVAIRPSPRLVEGELDRDDLHAVARWIGLNEAALLAYWDGASDTVELVQSLQRL